MTHVKFDGLGTFDAQSLRVLQNYVAFKSIAASKAVFEEQWPQEDTRGVSPNERLHLLNTAFYLPHNSCFSSSCFRLPSAMALKYLLMI